MLTSRRFTTKLTAATQRRIDDVLDNSKPMSRRERDRGAVVAVQAALSDLNQGYLTSSEVDGHFGRGTNAAVEAFQRDYGLFADGIVGRQTLLELDQLFSSDLFREPQGMSIHVGVNRVDENHYGTSVVELSACVRDAQDFERLASRLGYDTVMLTDEAATTTNFVAAFKQAAINLFAGDTLFVTFSGHGSQITSTSLDAEADGLDETLCLHDRMLIDDEVFCLLAELNPGVNVTMLYDSCHSATVSRDVFGRATTNSTGDAAALRSFEAAAKKAMQRRITSFDPDEPDGAEDDAATEHRFKPYARGELKKALEGDKGKQVSTTAGKGAVDDLAKDLVEIGQSMRAAPKRVLNDIAANQIYTKNQPLYDAVKAIIGERETDDLDCHVVAFSACQDNQTTLDGAVNGLYSGNVLGTWDSGAFGGSIRQLHRRLRRESPSDITPALNTYGGPRSAARLHERPFAI